MIKKLISQWISKPTCREQPLTLSVLVELRVMLSSPPSMMHTPCDKCSDYLDAFVQSLHRTGGLLTSLNFEPSASQRQVLVMTPCCTATYCFLISRGPLLSS